MWRVFLDEWFCTSWNSASGFIISLKASDRNLVLLCATQRKPFSVVCDFCCFSSKHPASREKQTKRCWFMCENSLQENGGRLAEQTCFTKAGLVVRFYGDTWPAEATILLRLSARDTPHLAPLTPSPVSQRRLLPASVRGIPQDVITRSLCAPEFVKHEHQRSRFISRPFVSLEQWFLRLFSFLVCADCFINVYLDYV